MPSYHQRDELPAWEDSVTLAPGVTPDLSTGWTPRVILTRAGQTNVAKTDGITGFADGRFQVQWATDELDLAAGVWKAYAIWQRNSDDAEFTATTSIQIKPRPVEEGS